MYELKNSELNIIFGKGNYEQKKGKIFVYTNRYYRYLKQNDKELRRGKNLCNRGRTGFINKISVLRAKIEDRILGE